MSSRQDNLYQQPQQQPPVRQHQQHQQYQPRQQTYGANASQQQQQQQQRQDTQPYGQQRRPPPVGGHQSGGGGGGYGQPQRQRQSMAPSPSQQRQPQQQSARRPHDVEMSSLVQQAAPAPYSSTSLASSTSALNSSSNNNNYDASGNMNGYGYGGGAIAAGTAGDASRDPHAVINECRAVTDEVTKLNGHLSALQAAQGRALGDPNNRQAAAELEAVTADITGTYKALIARLKLVKARPDAGAPINRGQIGLADRQLRDAWARYRSLESAHARRMREQIERQYRITRPDASDDEVRAAADDPDAQVFAQALMRSNRRGESRQVLGAVRERHEAIAKIERQMAELAALFQDMAETVAAQEPMVQAIEQSAVDMHENVEAGVQHLVPAVKSARAARKKKWICLGISIAIVVALVVVLLIILKSTGLI